MAKDLCLEGETRAAHALHKKRLEALRMLHLTRAKEGDDPMTKPVDDGLMRPIKLGKMAKPLGARRTSRWRAMTYVVLAFNILAAAIVVLLLGFSTSKSFCSSFATGQCDTVRAEMAGILFGSWVVGDIILGVLWMVTDPTRQKETKL
jgi:hypothetical protein